MEHQGEIFIFLAKNKIFDSGADHKWSVSFGNKNFPLQSIPWLSQSHCFVPPPVSVSQQWFPLAFPPSGMPMPRLDCRGTGVVPTFVNCLVFAILAACLSSALKLFTKWEREWRGQSTFHAVHGFFTLKIRVWKSSSKPSVICLELWWTKMLTFVH